MGVPYAFTKAIKLEALDKEGRTPKQQAEFLMEGRNMKGRYLGACLDSSRWGSPTTVLYEMNIRGLISFIQNWMKQNEDNFENLWHEKTIEDMYKKFELPYIQHESCPRDKNHKKIIMDMGGRVRCAHVSEEKLRPSFVKDYSAGLDNLSGMEQICFYEDKPREPLPDCAWNEETGRLLPEFEEKDKAYQKELERFEQEEPVPFVTDFCYAIISDRGRILPLETVIKRLNLRPTTKTVFCNVLTCKRISELTPDEKQEYDLTNCCPGHKQQVSEVEFQFDGWGLAFYVQKWYEQVPDGKAPVFEVNTAISQMEFNKL